MLFGGGHADVRARREEHERARDPHHAAARLERAQPGIRHEHHGGELPPCGVGRADRLMQTEIGAAAVGIRIIIPAGLARERAVGREIRPAGAADHGLSEQQPVAVYGGEHCDHAAVGAVEHRHAQQRHRLPCVGQGDAPHPQAALGETAVRSAQQLRVAGDGLHVQLRIPAVVHLHLCAARCLRRAAKARDVLVRRTDGAQRRIAQVQPRARGRRARQRRGAGLAVSRGEHRLVDGVRICDAADLHADVLRAADGLIERVDEVVERGLGLAAVDVPDRHGHGFASAAAASAAEQQREDKQQRGDTRTVVHPGTSLQGVFSV